ncbi:MAG: hypothetical protein AAF127_06750 [Pseudomonadota bacterium]
MSSWEYRVWDYSLEYENHQEIDWKYIERDLQIPGKDGWELVDAVPYSRNELTKTDGILYHFKRPVPEK